MSAATVLLDVDGTLADTNDAHARSWVDTLVANGFEAEYARVRGLIGMGGDKVIPALTGLDAEGDRGKGIATERWERFRRDYLPTIRATNGASDLIEALRARGLTLVIATSAKEEELEAILGQAGLDGLVRKKTSSDDAERSKPDPDIVRAALGQAGASAGNAVMLGDTPYDVEACRRANVACIALRSGGWWSDEALVGAAAIYDDPAELLRRLDESPVATLQPQR